MSRIDELIAEMCPDGVELKALGDVGTFVRGNGLQKKDLQTEGVGAIHYGQVFTTYGTSTCETKSYVSPELATRLRKAMPGDLVIATTSENDEDVCKAVAWVGDEAIAISGDAFVYTHQLDPLYVAYYFQTEAFQAQKRRFISGTKVKRVSGTDLARITIPVPPLEVQREVASILDKMEALQAELQAELQARSIQYAHYRQLILDRIDADAVALSTLGKWQGGVTPSKSNPAYWESGTVPWLASMDVSDTTTDEIRGRVTSLALEETSLRVVPAPSVAVVMRSNILRRVLPVGLIKVDTTVNQDMRALIPREGVDAEYVFQALQADRDRIRVSCVRTDGSMAAMDSQSFFDWEIPLPSLAEQRSVAQQLRRFDDLVTDLSVGLPAEIAARRQQYEYYRDKLLTFPERPDAA